MSIIYAAKEFSKVFIPDSLLLLYHRSLASIGAALYGYPSRKMVVIGVTGTKGKTTVVHFIADMLMQAGKKVGFVTGVSFRIGDKVWPNTMKMTMPGRFTLQKVLKQMVESGCAYAIVETTSEGIRQHRHRGIDYDIVALTNISPEHIESHGSYEEYREAKAKLFASLSESYRKTIGGKQVEKVKVLNYDDPERGFFEKFYSDQTRFFSMDESVRQKDDIISAKNISAQASGSAFTIDRAQFSLKVVGRHNIQNALAAIAVGYSIGLSFSHMSEALSRAHAAPGRFEEIPTKKNFRVFVDYAHEPASLRSAYEAVKLLKPRRLIAVLGSQGGGRDTKKRPVMGAIAAEYADVVIVTNEDPYDEPPENIIDDVAKGVLSQEKKFIENENVFKIIDRREAIHKALSLASDGGVVFVSGKGGEQVMAIKGGKNMPWDDREVIKAWLGS